MICGTGKMFLLQRKQYHFADFTEYSRNPQCLLDEQRGDQSTPLHLFHFQLIFPISVHAIYYSLIRQCDFLPG